jgi:hypothetical protein
LVRLLILLQRPTGAGFRSKNVLTDLINAAGRINNVNEVLITNILIFKNCQAWKGPAVC